MIKISVFVSGRGSNFEAIMKAIPNSLKKVEVCAVVSNKSDCGAVKLAESYGIPVYVASDSGKTGTVSYHNLLEILKEKQIDLIVLAGFLKKIPDEMIDEFSNRIVNIHPSLLPAFGGKGMYGMNVHKAVFEKSCMVSGPTVHFVDKIYDNGKIIAQEAVDISDVNSPEEIAAKVLRVEHKLLPFVIGKISEDKLKIKNNRVYLEN